MIHAPATGVCSTGDNQDRSAGLRAAAGCSPAATEFSIKVDKNRAEKGAGLCNRAGKSGRLLQYRRLHHARGSGCDLGRPELWGVLSLVSFGSGGASGLRRLQSTSRQQLSGAAELTELGRFRADLHAFYGALCRELREPCDRYAEQLGSVYRTEIDAFCATRDQASQEIACMRGGRRV